jgi:hypothetical protein
MRRRIPVLEIFIVAVVAVMLYFGWRHYGAGEFARFGPVIHAQKAPSALYARMLVRYSKPPIYEEEYRMQDVEGVSTFDYRIRGYDGRQITVTAPAAKVYDVSFFFGSLGEDGVWQLTSKPPRPNANAHYTVYVKQLADYKEGQRTITFTSPEYWAKLKGHRIDIDLSKQNPNDLYGLQSKPIADKRYQAIVDDFRTFGPPEFRRNVAAAQARIRAGH